MSKMTILLLAFTALYPSNSPHHFIIRIMFLCLMKSTKTKKTFPANEDCVRSVTIPTSYSPRNLRSLIVCTSYYLCKLNSVRVCTYYPSKLDFAKVCTSYYPRNHALHKASQFTFHFQGRFDHNYAINMYFIF
jgi:hypothetical protein